MKTSGSDEHWMNLALEQARLAADEGEVPVGAVVVVNDQLVGLGRNQVIRASDPGAHAEMQALRQAGQQLGNYRLPEATLYVTIEPCTMCFGAMVHARLQRLVYGAPEPKGGVVASQLQLPRQSFYNHRVQVTSGVQEEACRELMQAFFRQRRQEARAAAERLRPHQGD